MDNKPTDIPLTRRELRTQAQSGQREAIDRKKKRKRKKKSSSLFLGALTILAGMTVALYLIYAATGAPLPFSFKIEFEVGQSSSEESPTFEPVELPPLTQQEQGGTDPVSAPPSVVPPKEAPLWVQIPGAGITEPYKLTHESDPAIAGDPRRVGDLVWWSKGGYLGATLDNTPKDSVRDWTLQLSGHSSRTNNKAVFNRIPLLKVGDEMTVGSESGTWHYVAVETFNVGKEHFGSDPRYILDEPGRAFVYSCYQDGTPGVTTHISAVVFELVEFIPYASETQVATGDLS